MIVNFKVVFGKPKKDHHFEKIGENVFADAWPTKVGNYYHNEAIFAVVKGYFLDSSENDCSRYLADLYKKSGNEAFAILDGVFTAFVFDKKKQVGYFFQDSYGQGYPLYYFQNNNDMFVSTCLEGLISEMDTVEFDFSAAKEFVLARHILPGRKTLIRNINKLAPKELLVYRAKDKKFEVKQKQEKTEKVSKNQARECLLQSIEKAIKKICKIVDGKKTAMTLSGGYDTNLISYFLGKCHFALVKALTVVGKKKDESVRAGLMAEKSGKISHELKRVGDDALIEFAQIVKQLEGNVCESGIILQYFLAKKIAQAGIDGIILGDCADQILDPNIEKFSGLKEKVKSSRIGDLIYKLLGSHQRKSKYFKILKKLSGESTKEIKNFQLQFILKKSAIMLASFGIQGYYPFLNRETQKCSHSLGLEILNKRLYKKQVEKLFEKEGFPRPKKMGGSTDIEYLLEAKKEEISRILDSDFVAKIIENGDILDEIKSNSMKLPELILLLLYLYYFNLIFVKKEENPVF